MNTIYDVASTTVGEGVLRPAVTYPISASELVAANTGARNDLLVHTYKVYHLDSDPTQLYQSVNGQIVPVAKQKEVAAALGVYSPVFLVNTTRTLVDAYGVTVGEVGGGARYTEVLNYAALPGSPAAGETILVLEAQGIRFVNYKAAGLYRYVGAAWVYLGAVPEGYFTDNVLTFYDDLDASKRAKFELNGITTGTIRTLSVPDKDGIIATMADVVPGPTGPAGPQGIQGIQGTVGPTGPQGIQGLQGTVGPQGIQGLQGIQGDPGAAGAAGDIGPQGPQGLQGIQGLTGDAGPTGGAGPSNVLSIGTVTTGAAGSAAGSSITGTSPAQVLNLTIPRGDTGIQGVQGNPGNDGGVGPAGPANTLAIGTVTTGAAGSSASSTITGTAPTQTLNLTIPRGDQGIQGIQGIQGPAGSGGSTFALLSSVLYNSATASTAANLEANINCTLAWSISIPAGQALRVKAKLAFTTAATTTGVALGVNATLGAGTSNFNLMSVIRLPVTNAGAATEVVRQRRVASTTAAATIGTAVLNTASTTDQMGSVECVAINRGTSAVTLRIVIGSEVLSSAVTLLADSSVDYTLAAF